MDALCRCHLSLCQILRACRWPWAKGRSASRQVSNCSSRTSCSRSTVGRQRQTSCSRRRSYHTHVPGCASETVRAQAQDSAAEPAERLTSAHTAAESPTATCSLKSRKPMACGGRTWSRTSMGMQLSPDHAHTMAMLQLLTYYHKQMGRSCA